MKHRPIEFQVRDLVMVKLLRNQFKALRSLHKSLIRKYEKPFPIIERIRSTAYQLELSLRFKIHTVVHVSLFKRYHGDEGDPNRNKSKRAPTTITTQFNKEIDCILVDQVIRKRGIPNNKEYLIRWKCEEENETSWEREDVL